jgi:RNA polymerase sigma factor (sigma-70 family)
MSAEPLTDRESKLQIYLTHRVALIDYAASILGNRAWAEDVVQEAFLRISVDPNAHLRTIVDPVAYLYRVVRNLAVDWVRHHTITCIDDTSVERIESVVACMPTPEQSAIDRDELRIVEAALAELPERTRMIFQLHRIDGLTIQEIARQKNISITLAHQLIHRALRHCSSRLRQLSNLSG